MTMLAKVFEKCCTGCGITKSFDQFSKKNDKRRPSSDGLSSRCKDCEKERLKKYFTPERQKEYNQKAREKQCAAFGRRGASPEYKRMQRLVAQGVPKNEAWEIARKGPRPTGSQPDWEKAQDRMAEANAKQAWNFWMKEKAPDSWLDAYFREEPWRNHRKPEAEKWRLKYKHNPGFCVHQRIRAHMNRRKRCDRIGGMMRNALKQNGNSNKVESLLGYSISELRAHLERQFTRGMNWKRFASGEIHIDHIIPISSFTFEQIGDDEWRACWSLSNLRPAWAKENLQKHAKVLWLL